ncbi:hypothetical protein D1007_51785 [Hordeum vulgare]|nr:hypothetical protein D1007_51785 [Hordeum vulgare]
MRWSPLAAACTKVPPRSSLSSAASGQAFISASATRTWSIPAATWRAERPPESRTCTEDGGTALKMALTMDRSPSDDAKCSGVLPVPLAWLASDGPQASTRVAA